MGRNLRRLFCVFQDIEPISDQIVFHLSSIHNLLILLTQVMKTSPSQHGRERSNTLENGQMKNHVDRTNVPGIVRYLSQKNPEIEIVHPAKPYANSCDATTLQQTLQDRYVSLDQTGHLLIMDNLSSNKLQTTINQESIRYDEESPQEESCRFHSHRISPNYYQKINRQHVLGKMEIGFKRNHPQFSMRNYLSELQAKYYLQRLEETEYPNKLSPEHQKKIKQIRNEIFAKKVRMEKGEEEIKYKLPEIKKLKVSPSYPRISDKAVIKAPPILFESPIVEFRPRSPIQLLNMYKSQFKFKDGRLVLKPINERRRPDLVELNQRDKATNLLVNFYQQRHQGKHEQSDFTLDESRLMEDYQRLSNSIVRSVRSTSLCTSVNQQTLGLVQNINKIDKHLNQDIKRTKNLIKKNRFSMLQKSINKREDLLNSDITNLLLLVHDEKYVKEFKKSY